MVFIRYSSLSYVQHGRVVRTRPSACRRVLAPQRRDLLDILEGLLPRAACRAGRVAVALSMEEGVAPLFVVWCDLAAVTGSAAVCVGSWPSALRGAGAAGDVSPSCAGGLAGLAEVDPLCGDEPLMAPS